MRHQLACDVEQRQRPADMVVPSPNFRHLKDMTTRLGLWEHAHFSSPRVEHGFCVDDNARALILLLREPSLSPDLLELCLIYVRFLQDASLGANGFHNRRLADGSWADTRGSDDSQGRAIWALGTLARRGPTAAMRTVGLELFSRQTFASSSPRAHAFAILGADEVLAADPDYRPAHELMRRSATHLRILDNADWPWLESRLAYDNARIPEAMMAAGSALGNENMVTEGIRLLEWLTGVETRGGHFSFTPVGGWAPGEERPGFDQQPVEAAAFADSCARAWEITGDEKWRDHVWMAARWFMGDNDIGCQMYIPETGGGYDGLTSSGPNLNQGAESTLAVLSTLQQSGTVR